MVTSARATVAHGDSGGVARAPLLKALLEGSGEGVRVVLSRPVGLHQDLKERAAGSACVVVVDVALGELCVGDTAPLLEELSGRGNVTYVDHYPPPRTSSLGGVK